MQVFKVSRRAVSAALSPCVVYLCDARNVCIVRQRIATRRPHG